MYPKTVQKYGVSIQSSTMVREMFRQITQKLWVTDLGLGQFFIYLLRDSENELLKIQNISHATLCFLFDFCIFPQAKLLSNPTC